MNRRLGVAVLLLAGGVLVVVGATGLLAPDVLRASSGLPVVTDPGLNSEARAAGAVVLALGLVALAGARVPVWRPAAAAAVGVGLLAYALGRVVSWLLDGPPGPGVVAAGLVELLLGAAAAGWVLDARFGARTADRVSSAPR